MNMTQQFDEGRAIQALAYLADRASGRKITKLVALKVLYLADRYHLRKYGRTILGDEYRAMKYGPVAMHTMRLVERLGETGGDPSSVLSVKKIPGDRLLIQSVPDPDTSKLSKTDLESLDRAVAQLFLHADIVDFTHLFPEWKKHETAILHGASPVPMDYLDFFLPCDAPGAEYCDASAELVDMSRQDYQEAMAWAL